MLRPGQSLIAGLALLFGLMRAAAAAQFLSVGEGGAILYDAPSAQAKKLFVARRYYPVEVVVGLEQWVKVRDLSGDLTWVRKDALSGQRTVIVTAARAQVRSAPDPGAPVVFAAEKDVALNVIEIANHDWARVEHAGGQTGYVQASEVWGL